LGLRKSPVRADLSHSPKPTNKKLPVLTGASGNPSFTSAVDQRARAANKIESF
jgi:hypothetical protein